MGRLYEATYGRLFAAGYDWLLAACERAGLADRRRDLVARAAGATVEVGAGTGLNLSYYSDTVTDLVLTEPSPHMARRLRARRTELGRWAEVVEAPAEHLPFADASVDTVVATLVLCTVPDLPSALAEIRRVLRSHGRLLFLEHVRSADPRLAAWQDRWERPWRALTAGCRCNRDIAGAVVGAGFSLERITPGSMSKAPPIVQPLVAVVARPESENAAGGRLRAQSRPRVGLSRQYAANRT